MAGQGVISGTGQCRANRQGQRTTGECADLIVGDRKFGIAGQRSGQGHVAGVRDDKAVGDDTIFDKIGRCHDRRGFIQRNLGLLAGIDCHAVGVRRHRLGRCAIAGGGCGCRVDDRSVVQICLGRQILAGRTGDRRARCDFGRGTGGRDQIVGHRRIDQSDIAGVGQDKFIAQRHISCRKGCRRCGGQTFVQSHGCCANRRDRRAVSRAGGQGTDRQVHRGGVVHTSCIKVFLRDSIGRGTRHGRTRCDTTGGTGRAAGQRIIHNRLREGDIARVGDQELILDDVTDSIVVCRDSRFDQRQIKRLNRSNQFDRVGRLNGCAVRVSRRYCNGVVQGPSRIGSYGINIGARDSVIACTGEILGRGKIGNGTVQSWQKRIADRDAGQRDIAVVPDQETVGNRCARIAEFGQGGGFIDEQNRIGRGACQGEIVGDRRKCSEIRHACCRCDIRDETTIHVFLSGDIGCGTCGTVRCGTAAGAVHDFGIKTCHGCDFVVRDA